MSDGAFPDHHLLHPVGCGHGDDLADRSYGCARAIAIPVERLLQSVADQFWDPHSQPKDPWTVVANYPRQRMTRKRVGMVAVEIPEFSRHACLRAVARTGKCYAAPMSPSYRPQLGVFSWPALAAAFRKLTGKPERLAETQGPQRAASLYLLSRRLHRRFSTSPLTD
jgi:hypothetical protein